MKASHTFAALVALVLLAAGNVAATPAAADDPPLGCPGLVEVRGGYRLTRDAECGFTLVEDGVTLDLGGHTLTGNVYAEGRGQTLRNGTLVTRGEWWVADDFTVSHMTVRPLTPGGCLSFCIEAGDVTVEHSTFRDIGGIALDFYFGGGGTVRHSRFVGNRIGVSIQYDEGMVIEHNRFEDNDTGLNLWSEDGSGVNDTEVRHNTFRDNRVGMAMHGDDIDIGTVPLLSDNRVEHNRFVDNDEAGLTIRADCYYAVESCRLPEGNTIRQNRFVGNGFEVPEGAVGGHGAWARGQASIWDPELAAVDLPEGLAGFTFTRNQAHHNAALGFDVVGVSDGGGNRAWANGDVAQCQGLVCGPTGRPVRGPAARPAPVTAGLLAATPTPPPDQLAH